MSGDPGMALLNGLTDSLWLVELRRSYRDCDLQQEALDDLGDAASAAAQDHYEAGVIAEARAIVAGEIEKAPTVEHLRIALVWMDGARPPAPVDEDGEAPF